MKFLFISVIVVLMTACSSIETRNEWTGYKTSDEACAGVKVSPCYKSIFYLDY